MSQFSMGNSALVRITGLLRVANLDESVQDGKESERRLLNLDVRTFWFEDFS